MSNNLPRQPTPRAAVKNMRAYSPPSQGRADKVRLDFNENTVGCSPQVVAAIKQLVDANSMSMYPEYSQARKKIADFLDVSLEQLLFTNGTDEAISLLVNTFLEVGSELLLVHPSYAMYRFYGELGGAIITQVTYRIEDDLKFPLDQLLDAINPKTAAVFLANPNNPTGTGLSREAIIRVLNAAPQAVVLIDEAYVEFAGISVLDLIDQYPNLFVSRTFSKAYGMAGIRCGCLLSTAENIAWVQKTQSPYSVNIVAIVAAIAATKNADNGTSYVASYVTEVREARKYVETEFKRIGIRYFPSDANFLLFQVGKNAAQIKDQLAAHGVLVRDRSYEIEGCIRVTIGTREQMKLFIDELERAL